MNKYISHHEFRGKVTRVESGVNNQGWTTWIWIEYENTKDVAIIEIHHEGEESKIIREGERQTT